MRPALALGVLLLALCPALASAQDLPDASLPDASVGQGGADRGSEENDPGGPCLDSRDCEGGFTCANGRCVPGGVRRTGCGGTAALATVLVAAGLVVSRRCSSLVSRR